MKPLRNIPLPPTTLGPQPRVSSGLPLARLQRLRERSQAALPRLGERCEMCGVPIPESHGHIVDVQSRALMCVCRACYLLFIYEGASLGKYRAVPDRYLYDPKFLLTNHQWESLQIPVGIAFFFINSVLGRFVAFYPSPAGATESLLPLDIWDEVLAANPSFANLEPDVEALLINRLAQGSSSDEGVASPRAADVRTKGTECFLVPIDACYELAGRVRLHWRGFSGGEGVWQEIAAFFASLRAKSLVVASGGEHE